MHRLVVKIPHPVGEEVLDVEEKGCCRREHRDITGPAEALVSLRAISGHIEEIAAQTPHDVLVEPIQQRVRGDEGPRPLQVGADDHGDECIDDVVVSARPSCDLDIAEPVEGERRLENVNATGKNVRVGRLRAAQGAGGELAVFDLLGVAEDDLRPCASTDFQSGPSDDVLAEIDEQLALRGAPHAFDATFALPGDDRAGVRLEPGRGGRDGLHATPCIRFADASIDRLAPVEVGAEG